MAALESLASDHSETFLEWLALHEHENATPAQRMFAHALASQPEKFAERAAKFLLDDTNRFHLGSIADLSGTTKRLVKVTSSFWTDKTLGAPISHRHTSPITIRAALPRRTGE